jgi:hypothetical protein
MRSPRAGTSSRQQRSWGVAEQKIVAASQKWCCAHCACSLPASFEVDHRVPLWAGGADCWKTNAQALCPTCHASKTQRESIERRNLRRAKREAAIRLAKQQAEEEERRRPRVEPPAEPAPPPPPPPKPPEPTPEEREQNFLSDNPFLKYAFVAPQATRMRSLW